jgi:D-methionine transport system substrate-binding protein
MTIFSKKVLTIAAAAVLTASLIVGCKKDDDFTVVKMGINGEVTEVWTPIKEALAKDKIRLELVQFSDYVQPNQALEDGEIDMNAFQTHAHLNKMSAEHGYHLAAIADTIMAPIGLYSRKIKSVSELKKGDKIGIPNDVTTEGRSLQVLAKNGLITLKPDAGLEPDVSMVADNPLELEFVLVAAAQAPRTLDDVTAGFVNGAYAIDAGLTAKDAILREKQNETGENPYINTLTVRTADKDNPVYQKVVKAYQTDEVKAVYERLYGDAYITAW